MKMHPGYIARNLDVAKAYGLEAGLCTMKARMGARRDCPLWFLEKIDDLIHRSSCLISPLVEHRDELPKTLPGVNAMEADK